jgi:hypothetical protein
VTDSTRTKTPNATATDLQFEALEAERALFEGRVQGLIAVITPDEKPPQGLAGLLDWRFQGAISKGLAHGFLTGRAGECAYLPVTRAGTTYHMLLVGAGSVGSGSDAYDGGRGAIPTESLKALKKNLSSLKLARLGISRADWNGPSDEFFAKNLKGTGLCILK